MPSPNRRIAMLIDGDNAQPALMKRALAETEKHGSVITRRVYGNWANSGKSAWKAAINSCAALPVQQFAYVAGKNATDIALIIEAMDLLHSGTVDGFCIVSSDSDYTRLAIRIREEGMFVMGVGLSSTPEPFVTACEVFIPTESLADVRKPKQDKATPVSATQKIAVKRSTKQNTVSVINVNNNSWIPTITQAINIAGKGADKWAHLGALGNQIKQIHPEFKPNDYGHNQLGKLIRSRSDLFETKGSQAAIYVRTKLERE